MTPQNEMGVIVVFAQQAHEADFEIISIGCEFPDAIVKKDGKVYRAEFEFKSSNFLYHKHNPMDCDLIICWVDNAPDPILPVIELSNPDWKTMEIAPFNPLKLEIAHWKERALIAESELSSIPKKIRFHKNGKRRRLLPEQKREMALNILREFPAISGAELGRQLGLSERQGQNILSDIKARNGVGK